MHQVILDFDINLSEISKIEGAAALDIQIRGGVITNLKFSISEWKRFYTQAIRGKPVVAVSQLLSRICGTCSNAHLLASIESIEKTFQIIPSEQTMLLRKLLYYGLIIRDHALHLYIFSLPDLLGKDSILDFDENNPLEHELLHDAFAVKEAGNQLSIATGGRSVHAPYPTIGGFLKLPKVEDLKNLKAKLLNIRPKVLKIIELFAKSSFALELQSPLIFSSLQSPDFSFLEGVIETSKGQTIQEKDLGSHLNAVIIPYSQARGFTFDGEYLMVGALARLNMGKERLHPQTIESAKTYLQLFPTRNLFLNNVAQAIEILHAIDSSIAIIDGLTVIREETPPKLTPKEGVGIGVIEAPRGTLYHKLEISPDGVVKHAEIIVPTGQNQVVMEKGIHQLIQSLLNKGTTKEEIIRETETFIRAFDPCMSCAAHFLKVKWSS